LTESGVKDHEDARAHAMAVSNFGNRLAELDPEAFLSIEERMSNDIQSHSGKSLSREDQIWSLGNKMALEAMKRQDMDMLSQILWVQASYLYSQNKNYFPIMAKFHEIKLKQIENKGIQSVEIIADTNSSCPACKKLNRKVLSVSDAIKYKLLPCKDCSFGIPDQEENTGWCRCCYMPSD
jgi:hypothetical protein